jgi:hypothetical protein
VGGALAVAAVILTLTSGLTGLLTVIGGAALVTGIYVLVTGRRSWARLPSRAFGAAGIALFVVSAVGVGAIAQLPHPQPTAGKTGAGSVIAAPRTPAPTFNAESPVDPSSVTTSALDASVPVTSASATSDTAIALLATLPVKPALTMSGYVRTADFGTAWLDVDRNGCDTRNDILARDLTGVVRSGPCRVTSGTLVSPYTGATIDFVRGENTSALVQIDHIVALGDAWETGAQALTQAQRITLANDPLELTAVDGRSNDEKGDKDAASWLPSNSSFDCAYVARQISVKVTYALWITPAEHDAMAKVLASCSTVRGTASPFASTGSEATPAPATGLSSAAPPTTGAVHAGAYCSVAGSSGVSTTGKAMVCVTTATDSRLRWRSP